MAIDRKWVIYNTLTGVILNELPASEDNVYLDINNGDEATLVIPAYSLSNDDRVQWTKVFKPWARGIALIDNTKTWDATGAIIFAGPIVKRSFNGREEKITLTAYGIYEYLKKITVPPVWTEVTDATLTETFTADSWAGVYSAILQRGTDDTGKPTGWNFMKTFTGLPTVTGTGKTYTVKVVDQKTVAECFEDIRDNVSTNGNEFKFTPVFTDLDADTITWTLTVGTDTVPKINYTALTVPLYEEETPTYNWRASEYNVDDDNTLIYNKLVINGSTDSVTANLEAVYDLTTDPDMPGLTERYEPGVTLTQAQLDAQKAARIKGSLVGDKNVTLTISQDEALETFTMVGKKLTLDVSLSDKMAGTGATVRAVGIRFTNANRENSIDVDLMKIQARYPKLPKDTSTDFIMGDGGYDDLDISYGGGADFGNPELDYGSGGSGFDTGGEGYVAPPFEPVEPEVTDPNMLLYIPSSTTGTALAYTQYQTNANTDGYWYQPTRPTYVGSTDTFTTDMVITMRRMTVNESAGREPRANINTIGTYTVSAATLNAAMNTLPATISVWYAGSPAGFETCSPTNTDSYVSLNAWTIKNKLYIVITKQRRYANATAYHSSGYRYEQKMFTLDINPADGTLSNFTTLAGKFGPSAYASNDKIFVLPVDTGFDSVPNDNYSIFPVDVNNTLFMTNRVFTNFNYVGNGWGVTGIDLTYWDSTLIGLRAEAIKHIKGDFTNTSAPVFTESNITPIVSKTTDTTSISVWDGTDYGIMTNPYSWYYNSGGGSSAKYGVFIFDPYIKKIYGTLFGGGITTEAEKVWVLDYGNGETIFTTLDNTYQDLLDAGTYYLTLIPVDDYVYLQPAMADYNNTDPIPRSKIVFKEGSWVRERSNDSGTGELTAGYNYQQVFFLRTSTNQGLTVLGNGLNNSYIPTFSFTRQLSPYKALANYATSSAVIDSTGKLWHRGEWGTEAGYTPTFTEQDIYLKTPISNTWKQVETNFGTGATATQIATLAIDTNGYLWGWGQNGAAITAQGTTTGVTAVPTQIGTKTWSKIVVGVTAAAGIDTDGKLFTWGLNTNGTTAQGTSSGTTLTPTQVGTDTYIDVDIHRGLMVINTAGQLKYSGVITSQTTVNVLTDISQSKTWKKVNVGDLHYMAINNTDKLFVLGSHLNGRTGLGLTTGSTATWTQVNASNWKEIYASKDSDLAIYAGASFGITTGGELYEWGSAWYIGNTVQQNVPSLVGTHTDWVGLYKNAGDVNALRQTGLLYNSTGAGSEAWTGTLTSKWRTIFGGETETPAP